MSPNILHWYYLFKSQAVMVNLWQLLQRFVEENETSVDGLLDLESTLHVHARQLLPTHLRGCGSSSPPTVAARSPQRCMPPA